ncbi:amino acid adenylation domain-containing protein [Chromohalobacter sp.]|uniref:amino acid adenylation domain-containing protein n=1 Tax=Chromohalobacter sp. TaxID=50740 RepID=UPI0025904FDF|nr:amino acid adenylation domain-containing protein [Chromohalobacter sp.]MCI0592828.1 amino acid adenylation domain-containing protein [Chromohalobacter sp.]
MALNTQLPSHDIPTTLDTLSGMLAWQARTRPDAPAVISDDTQVSMADLASTAGSIAKGILSSAPGVSECLGLYADPSPEMISGLWGILWASRAYLPLAVEYPEERIRYIVEHSGSNTILTQAHLKAQLQRMVPHTTQVLVLEELLREPASEAATCTLEDLGYVIYTSGSTGKPKGVMISQEAVVNQLRWLSRQAYLRPGVRILQKTPVSFDAAQWELLAPAVGAAVVSGRPGMFRDAHAIISSIQRHSVTNLQCVPTLLSALVEDETFLSCTSLSTLFSGGEALSQKLARKVLTSMPHVDLVNLYGPTECTINATSHHVCVDELTDLSCAVSIGTPVDGVTCHILDSQMNHVPDGEEGELYLGGIQLAKGYRNSTELTRERFVFLPGAPQQRLYRTGDICSRQADGTLRFAGRSDHQVKLRGYRVELEEIIVAIEAHLWVRHASVVVLEDERTKGQSLTACIELNDKEAALMDQGVAGSHHQSKANKLQVKAQLANPGLRDDLSLASSAVTSLPGSQPFDEQRRKVFARKTYRFYDGGITTRDELAELISDWQRQMASPKDMQLPREWDIVLLSDLLRWFGSFQSEARLLPKYAYASPGALYATQLYVECAGIPDVEDGIHYYHPLRHTLIRVASPFSAIQEDGPRQLRFHFAGKRKAIEPVYKNNIREVLEIETGHMLGLLDEVLIKDGHSVTPAPRHEYLLAHLGLQRDDFDLGSFACVPAGRGWRPNVELYVQSTGLGTEGLEPGTWKIMRNKRKLISNNAIASRDVIAINQQVFNRSSVGLSILSREQDASLGYVALGYALHKFQRNEHGFGFMSSGYSSKSGNPLPAARRFDGILHEAGIESGPMYFFIGGKVSEAQRLSEGMHEDSVHMQGPAEMIRDELARSLPDYMIPDRVLVFDRLPLSANGKVDHKAVAASDQLREAVAAKPYKEPDSPTERWLATLWSDLLDFDPVSREDEFFLSGGNSLVAISMLASINKHFGLNLPAQVVFECPKLSELATRIDEGMATPSSRLIPLNDKTDAYPIFCWPGLGGYPMNLRPLAQTQARPFIGIQCYGLNEGETPYSTIAEMARADVEEFQHKQPSGPITLWGYSFGARLAFEAAWQLEQAGRQIDHLVLICPGNPHVDTGVVTEQRDANLSNLGFAAILLSVFFGKVDIEETKRCMAQCANLEAFIRYVHTRRPEVGVDTVRRITQLVCETYEFEYNFAELKVHRVSAPIDIVKAQGDDYSFLENASSYAAAAPRVLYSASDHYQILRDGPVRELAGMLTRAGQPPQGFEETSTTSASQREVSHAAH